MVDSTLVSDTMAYHHWNGKVDPEWQRKAVNHLFSMQLPDGGWNIYYGGPSEVNATIKAYLALKLAGVSVKDPRMLQGPRNGAAPRRRAAHEHLFQAVPRVARALFLGIRAHDPVRSAAHRQMVPCEFLGHEQLVARHARAAGHHQPFQAHPPVERGRWTSCIPKASTSATSRSRPTRKSFPGAISSSGSTGCTSSPNGSPNIESIPFRKTAL